MKTTELMIGDWVYAIDDNGEKHPCRANDLKYDYINKCDDFCVDFYGTEYDPEWPDVTFNVEPIPLTPEILEKNFPTYEWLAWGPSDMLDTIPAFTIRIDEDYAHIEIDLRYVHELQHALRLCGIEKEITI